MINGRKTSKQSCVSALALTLFQLLQLCLSHRIDPEIQKKINDFIVNYYLPESHSSALGLAVVQNDGEVLYTAGYGMANLEKEIPNGETTQFMIASVAKTFTATLVAKVLHEKFRKLGETVLEMPIRKLIPQANLTLIDRFGTEMTSFRDLLSHRLCLFRDDILFLADPLSSTEEIVYRLRYNEKTCAVRTKYQYNNQVYALAGHLIGILLKRPFEDVMQDFFNELGMVNTTFVRKTDDFAKAPNRAMPYYLKDNKTQLYNIELTKRIEITNAASGIISTPTDMVRFMKFQLNFGSLDGKQIVPREVMEWMRKPSIILGPYSFRKSDERKLVSRLAYGLGLMMGTYDGWEHVYHSGSLPLYLSLMSLYPGKNLGIFTTTNFGTIVKFNQMLLHTFIFETLNGKDDAMQKTLQVKNQTQSEKAEAKSHTKKDVEALYTKLAEEVRKTEKEVVIAGKYGKGSAGDVEVYTKVDTKTNRTEYYLEYGRWYKGWLVPEPERGMFSLRWDTDVYQDDYVFGFEAVRWVAFDNDSLTFVGYCFPPTKYKRGVSLKTLPDRPWTYIDSCESEVKLQLESEMELISF